MKYQPPYGSTDPNASFVNGNPSTAVEGSIPPAGALEEPQREIINAILLAGLTPTDADLTQLMQAVSSGIYLGIFTGPANSLAAALPGAVTIPVLQAGMTFHGYVGPSPNTAAATLTISGFGTNPVTAPIRRKDGSAISAGDLLANALVSFRWDGTYFRITAFVTSDIGLIATGSSTTVIQQLAKQIAIYPAMNAATNGQATLNPSAGQLVVGGSNIILHRGFIVYPFTNFTPAQLTFGTAPNSTYHLVWYAPGHPKASPAANYPNGNLVLQNLADAVNYNTASLTEDNIVFDTSYDSMLIARVVTNAANALTVTALINLQSLYQQVSNNALQSGAGTMPLLTFALNWGRAPVPFELAYSVYNSGHDSRFLGIRSGRTRYAFQVCVDGYDPTLPSGAQFLSGTFTFDLRGFQG